MKILYHHRTQADGGEGVHISEMINAFRDLGHSVEVVALVKGGEKSHQKNRRFWEWIAKFSPKIFYELMEIAYNLIGYLKLSKAIKVVRPNFIYERYALHNFAGIIAAKRYKIPLFLEVNSPLAYEKEKHGKIVFKELAKITEKRIFSYADKVIVVSDVLKKYLLNMGIVENKIHTIPNGVNIKRFNDFRDDGTIRERYGLEEKPVVGFCGSFDNLHNVNIILDIVKEIKSEDINLHLLLVGDGPAKGSLERCVQEYALQDDVIFTDRIKYEEIPKYISVFDIALLLPIPPYSSPIKIFEYMIMGKPIIAPKMENIEEILTDNKNALLFKPEDKEELKEAIFKLASNPELRKRLGNNAKETIFEREYFWKNNAERVIKIYKAMIHKEIK